MTEFVGEEFGAGIVSSGTPDAWSQLKSQFEGLPEDLTMEQFADHTLGWKAEADKAAEYKAKIAEYEATLAAQAQSQYELSQKPAPTPAQEAAAVRRWERMQVDNHIVNLVSLSADGQGYVPTNSTSPVHIAAAAQMNKKYARDQELTRSFVDDPYQFMDEVVGTKLTAYKQAMEKRFAELQEKFTPIEQYAQKTTAEEKRQAWINENYAELFGADGQMTNAGRMVDSLLQNPKFNGDENEALAEARKFSPQPQQPNPGTLSVSRVAKASPQRFIDTLSEQSRVPIDSPERRATENKRPGFNDLRELANRLQNK
jgi:hypothetical protein